MAIASPKNKKRTNQARSATNSSAPTPRQGAPLSPTAHHIPPVICSAGAKATKRFATFFTDNIRNAHTRAAYLHASATFFRWCQERQLAFSRIESYHVSAYLEYLLAAGKAKSTVKQHLAAIRMLFDWLVVGQVCAVNPAHAVRGPKLVIKKGKTPHLEEDEARHLLQSIDTSHVVGLRDRSLIGLMIYSFARVSAALAMNVDDYFPKGKRWYVRLHEKGGKEHEMVAHHKLEEFLDAYLAAADIRHHPHAPLFQTTYLRTRRLTGNRMTRSDAYRMMRRRANDAGILTPIGCHTGRATGITNYLRNEGKLEIAMWMANHESSRTTGLYDHRGDEVSLDEIERIRI